MSTASVSACSAGERRAGPLELMRLELTDDEVLTLRRVLHETVRDLSPEIANTDNPYFRRGLVAHRDQLLTILEKLGGPPPPE